MVAIDDLISVEKAKRKAHERKCSIVLGSIFAFLIIFVIIIILINTLSYPSLYIQDLYVPALSKTTMTTTTFNTSVFIDLKFKRAAPYSCPNYTYFQMNLFYGENRQMPVAQHLVEGFGLGRRKELVVKAAIEAPMLPWEEASRAVSSGSKVVLMVQLMVIQAPEICNILNPHTPDDGKVETFAADVAVDASGHKVSKKPIKIK